MVAKFSECLGKLKSLRKINLRKFEYSLDGIVGLPDSMRLEGIGL